MFVGIAILALGINLLLSYVFKAIFFCAVVITEKVVTIRGWCAVIVIFINAASDNIGMKFFGGIKNILANIK